MKFQAVRGMPDILPEQTPYWAYLEKAIRSVVAQYGYREIRLPIVEPTALFEHSIGEITDIVSKEMYTFMDRNNERVTLRPEGTAGCLRACIQHGLLHHQVQRLWYSGPMFRYERPQQGRYRQFYQLGVEAYGVDHAAMDAEVILLAWRLLRLLRLDHCVTLELNSLADHSTRQRYRQALTDYFTRYHDQLDTDSQRRLQSNPLRILDSKHPQVDDLLQNAPQLPDFWDSESRAHFEELTGYLAANQIPYRLQPHLVRGLDYYNRTVFEWTTDQLGAQRAVCAGGRYDLLAENLGGNAVAAVGFACGLERLVLLLQQQTAPLGQTDIYILALGHSDVQQYASRIAERLRDHFSQLQVSVHLQGGSVKTQFKHAAKSGARFALVLGSVELANQCYTLKDLHHRQEQQGMSEVQLIDAITQYLATDT